MSIANTSSLQLKDGKGLANVPIFRRRGWPGLAEWGCVLLRRQLNPAQPIQVHGRPVNTPVVCLSKGHRARPSSPVVDPQ